MKSLFTAFCDPDLVEPILGDLHEYYQRIKGPKWQADLAYLFQMLSLLRPFAIRRFKLFFTFQLVQLHFTLAFRTLRRNVVFTAINVLGLGLAFATCLLIMAFVMQESAYDLFHPDADKIYRVEQSYNVGPGEWNLQANTISRVSEELNQSVPGVAKTCRLTKISKSVAIGVGDRVYRESGVLGVDSTFLDVFGFQLLQGNPDQAFSPPFSIVLSERMANRYFPDGNALGQKISMEGAFGFWSASGYQDDIDLTVTGVIQNSQRSHIPFEFLVPFSIYPRLEQELSNWGAGFHTYVKLTTDESSTVVQKTLDQIALKYEPDGRMALFMTPISSIHLDSQLLDELQANGNRRFIELMIWVGLIILIIAATNYVNFTLVSVLAHQQQIAIHRVLSAQPAALFRQQFISSFLVQVISLMVGAAILAGIAPAMEAAIGFNVVQVFDLWQFWLGIIGLLLFSSLLSGLYPAWVTSSVPGLSILGRHHQKGRLDILRKGLMMVQFTLCVLVIGFSLIAQQQLRLMNNTELGMDIDNTLVIGGPRFQTPKDSVHHARLKVFKEEATSISGVQSVALGNFLPGRLIPGHAEGYMRLPNQPENEARDYYFSQVDYDFLEQFQFELLAGRFFDEQRGTDRQGLVINEKASRQLGFQRPSDAIGQQIVYRMDRRPTIIGVISDFHQLGLQTDYQPILLELRTDPKGYVFVKTDGPMNKEELLRLGDTWNDIFVGNPFDYGLLRDIYHEQYSRDQQFIQALTTFSILILLVSTLGLAGMAFFIANARLKEIGIRKALGAGLKDIYGMLGRGVFAAVIAASLMAAPLIYLVGQSWLDNYTFRVSLQVWMFITPIAVLFVATGVVLWMQSVRTLKSAPVDLLREE